MTSHPRTCVAGHARAVVLVDEVVAGGAVVAWVRLALVDVGLAVRVGPAGRAGARVAVDAVVAGRSVEAGVGGTGVEDILTARAVKSRSANAKEI